jgi:hypothetical protein
MDTIKKPASKQQQISEVRRHNWEVMKPFVKFSITALGIIGYALISLIKHLPKPERHHDQKNKLIKL